MLMMAPDDDDNVFRCYIAIGSKLLVIHNCTKETIKTSNVKAKLLMLKQQQFKDYL